MTTHIMDLNSINGTYNNGTTTYTFDNWTSFSSITPPRFDLDFGSALEIVVPAGFNCANVEIGGSQVETRHDITNDSILSEGIPGMNYMVCDFIQIINNTGNVIELGHSNDDGSWVCGNPMYPNGSAVTIANGETCTFSTSDLKSQSPPYNHDRQIDMDALKVTSNVPCFSLKSIVSVKLPSNTYIQNKNAKNNIWHSFENDNTSPLLLTNDHIVKINGDFKIASEVSDKTVDFEDDVVDIVSNDGRFIDIKGVMVKTSKYV